VYVLIVKVLSSNLKKKEKLTINIPIESPYPLANPKNSNMRQLTTRMAKRRIEILGLLRFLMIDKPATQYKIKANIFGSRSANSELPNRLPETFIKAVFKR
jgi:hypothetical protein